MAVELTDKSCEKSKGRLYVPYNDLLPHRYWWDEGTETFLPSWKRPLPEGLRLRPGIHEGYRMLLKLREIHLLLRRRGPMNELERFVSRIDQREIDSLIWLFEQRARPWSQTPEAFAWPRDIRFSESLAMGAVLGWEKLDVAPGGASPGETATFDEFLLWCSATGTDFDTIAWRTLYNSAESAGAFMYSEPLWVSADSIHYPEYAAFLRDFSEKSYRHAPEGLTIWRYMRIMRDRFYVDAYRSLYELEQLRRRGFLRISSSRIEPVMRCESDVGSVLASYAAALSGEDAACGRPTSIAKDVARALLDAVFAPLCPECGEPLRGREGRVECVGCYRQCLFPQHSVRTDPFWYACAAVESRTLIHDARSGIRRPVEMEKNERTGNWVCVYID